MFGRERIAAIVRIEKRIIEMRDLRAAVAETHGDLDAHAHVSADAFAL